MIDRAEARRDGRIERLILAEPIFARKLAEPKIENPLMLAELMIRLLPIAMAQLEWTPGQTDHPSTTFSGKGSSSPQRRKDAPHNESHPPAILLPNLAGGNESSELVSFHSGDSFAFSICHSRGAPRMGEGYGTVSWCAPSAAQSIR